MCGIFAYLNYLTPKTRKEIIDLLINGLKRLEYRGYDSAGKMQSFYRLSYKSSIHMNVPGIGIDGENGVTLVRNTGKVAALQEAIDGKAASLAFDDVHEVHVGISHTRW